MSSSPLPVALCYLVSRGRILLIRRRGAVYSGLWGLPGGKIKAGESPLQAASRELFEETGIRAIPEKLLGVASEIEIPGNNHFLLFIVKLDASGIPASEGENREGEWKFFPVNALPSGMIASDRVFITKTLHYMELVMNSKKNTIERLVIYPIGNIVEDE